MKSTAHALLALYWRQSVLLLAPLLLLPLLIASPTQESRCAFVVCLMATFWVTEALPLPVTSLLPVALFPLLGVLSTAEVCAQYLKDTNMMFLGGLIIAIAVEHCDLHRKVALVVLMLVRGSPHFLLLGIMLTTMFLSMWISNLAATAMMLPISTATLAVLAKCEEGSSGEHDLEGGGAVLAPAEKLRRQSFGARREAAYLLAIAYAATIGGRGTLPGASSNLVYVGILESAYKETSVTYATWMAFNVPTMLVSTLLTWALLQHMHMRCRWCCFWRREHQQQQEEEERRGAKVLREEIRQQYATMGRMTFQQVAVSTLFLLAVLLWLTRDPRFVPGWTTLMGKADIKDATPAIAVVLLLFVLPADLRLLSALRRWWLRPKSPAAGGLQQDVLVPLPAPALLPWDVAVRRLSWGVLVLMGGSYAMSLGMQTSGLSSWLGQQLQVVRPLPQPLVALAIMLMAAALTEVASNAAVTSILVPIVNDLSLALHINPIYLTLPCALASSFSFMLPVATPSNALVMAAAASDSNGQPRTPVLTTATMAKMGLATKAICLAVVFLLIHVYAPLLFDLSHFPDWAQQAANRTVLPAAL